MVQTESLLTLEMNEIKGLKQCFPGQTSDLLSCQNMDNRTRVFDMRCIDTYGHCKTSNYFHLISILTFSGQKGSLAIRLEFGIIPVPLKFSSSKRNGTWHLWDLFQVLQLQVGRGGVQHLVHELWLKANTISWLGLYKLWCAGIKLRCLIVLEMFGVVTGFNQQWEIMICEVLKMQNLSNHSLLRSLAITTVQPIYIEREFAAKTVKTKQRKIHLFGWELLSKCCVEK